MQKRYQIFISSTYNDLKVERKKVIEAVLKLYHFPIGMEMFHADNEEQWTQIKNTIDMSDYYILILGRYCGTLIESEGISYTEKEYNYAISKGIPVLSFVIDDAAKKESYGIESRKQVSAFKKFSSKVRKLPCSFWMTPEDLAFKVSTTLSAKFLENNRNGWVPYDETMVFSTGEMSTHLIGRYDVYYYSGTKSDAYKKSCVHSKLIIHESGQVTYLNNIKHGETNPEYIYHGRCILTENVVSIYLKNDFSNERPVMFLSQSVGNLHRFIGLFLGLSSNSVPAAVKLACFAESFPEKEKLNWELLESVLVSDNKCWDNVLIIEDAQKALFFSNAIIQNESQIT